MIKLAFSMLFAIKPFANIVIAIALNVFSDAIKTLIYHLPLVLQSFIRIKKRCESCFFIKYQIFLILNLEFFIYLMLIVFPDSLINYLAFLIVQSPESMLIKKIIIQSIPQTYVIISVLINFFALSIVFIIFVLTLVPDFLI